MRLTLPILLSALTLALLAPGHAQAKPPADFFGLETPDAAYFGNQYRAVALDRQRAAGVGLIRQVFYWSRIERQPGVYDYSVYDSLVGDAAKRGIRIMPLLFDTPDFRSSRPLGDNQPGTFPPSVYSELGDFGAAMARRYGPNGSFWREHPELPKLPVGSYQVWNEPHIRVYWPRGPNPAEYTQLLLATSQRIKAVDPAAEIVAAGISESGQPGAIGLRAFIQGMYAAGARQGFDTLAVHPYARDASRALELVEAARELMVRNGDAGSKLWVTEFGWGSGGPPSHLTTDEAGQAERLRALMTDLATRRTALGLRGLIYWQWRDNPDPPETWASHSGLVRVDGSEKPALGAYRSVAAQFLGLPLPAGHLVEGGDFVGLNSSDAFEGSPRYRDVALRSHALLGVQVLRQTFDWRRIERSRGRYDLARHDAFVASAAARGIRVLPVLRNAPRFLSQRRGGGSKGVHPPRRSRDLGRFAAVLVNRYGPNGTLWRERPNLPRLAIQAWQIWHEPNSRRGWAGGPAPSRYAALLRGASRYIKRADPRAEVVTASLATGRGAVAPRRFLARVYRARGRSGFDTVGMGVYAPGARSMIRSVRLTRRVMDRYGDRRARVWITEFGWADRGSRSRLRVGRRGQARRIGQALHAVARERRRLRVRGVVYASWRDRRLRGRSARSWRRYTGLLDTRGRRKPAFRAFELGIRPLRLGNR